MYILAISYRFKRRNKYYIFHSDKKGEIIKVLSAFSSDFPEYEIKSVDFFFSCDGCLVSANSEFKGLQSFV